MLAGGIAAVGVLSLVVSNPSLEDYQTHAGDQLITGMGLIVLQRRVGHHQREHPDRCNPPRQHRQSRPTLRTR